MQLASLVSFGLEELRFWRSAVVDLAKEVRDFWRELWSVSNGYVLYCEDMELVGKKDGWYVFFHDETGDLRLDNYVGPFVSCDAANTWLDHVSADMVRSSAHNR